MSHYGIIKRNKYVKYPCYVETLKTNDVYHKIAISFTDMEKINNYEYYLKNVIYEQQDFVSLYIYWEGEVLQDVFTIGDEINVNGEIFKIQKVEKNINGQVIYEVDDLIEKHSEYEMIMKDCILMDKYYKERLWKYSEHFNKLDDEFKEIKKELPWWQRLFH